MFENLQGFFESTLGQIVTVGVIAILFLFILIPNKEQKNQRADTKAVTLSALLVALATGLGMLKLFEMPYLIFYNFILIFNQPCALQCNLLWK